MFGKYASVTVQEGMYRIEMPVDQLQKVSEDVRDRLFTRKQLRRVTYDDVNEDLNAFLDTLQLSRSITPTSTPGTPFP